MMNLRVLIARVSFVRVTFDTSGSGVPVNILGILEPAVPDQVGGLGNLGDGGGEILDGRGIGCRRVFSGIVRHKSSSLRPSSGFRNGSLENAGGIAGDSGVEVGFSSGRSRLLGLHGAALTIGSNAAPMVQRETKRILKINDSNGRSVYGKRVYERKRWREEKKKTLIGIKEQTTL
ncbi:hypothetical protein FCULG_00006425 [Fusarium culmorum]|uniref:Uncharacterized protein n=1 Tax=Fusarium culmorum TaxID=5516 RepID=A0A2T4GW04_FUSCU|nr:hypothetical protein FCULG_00006425 [Fusarium culmorum]